MVKLSELQQLIGSLSKAEKRQFRLACGSNKAYLQLFDFYLSNPDADTKRVKRKLGSSTAQQLSVKNDYLYQRLMQCLKHLHARASVDFQIREHIQHAEVLFDRDLILQSQAELKRAEDLARRFHRPVLLNDIHNLQRKILLTKEGPVKAADALNTWANEHAKALAHEQENLGLWQDLIALGQGKALSSKRSASAPQIDSDNLPANLLRLHIQFANSVMNNQIEQGLQAITRLIALTEQHPFLIEDDPNGYVTTINNKISLLLYLKDKDELQALFQRLHQLHTRYRIRRVNPSLNRQLLRSYNIELEYYRENFDIEEGLRLIPAVNTFMEKNRLIVPNDYWLMIYYQFAFFNFAAENFRQASTWLNKLNRISPLPDNPTLRLQAKILNLCLLYQFNQLGTLKYAVENTRRFAKNHTIDLPAYQYLIKLFSRLCLTQDKLVKKQLQRGQQELAQQPTSADTRAYLAWLQTRVDAL